MAHVFSDKMANIIRDATGMSVEEIRQADTEAVHCSIEQQIGHPLTYGYEPGHETRGNVLIQAQRIIRPGEIERFFERF